MTAAQGSAGTEAQAAERLKRLAAYGPIFRDPTTRFGTWHGGTGEGTALKPLTFPWFELSDAANRFAGMLYECGWILPDFDWMQWIKGREGKALYANREAIALANVEQLAKLLTALVRRDRFSEGALARAYEDKILLSIVERAEDLLRDIQKNT